MTLLRGTLPLQVLNISYHVQGVNAYVYADDAYTLAQIIRLWGRYRNSIDPQTSLSRHGRDVGRYNEMICSDSKKICAAKLTDSKGSK
jgi:hypothetical protein